MSNAYLVQVPYRDLKDLEKSYEELKALKELVIKLRDKVDNGEDVNVCLSLFLEKGIIKELR